MAEEKTSNEAFLSGDVEQAGSAPAPAPVGDVHQSPHWRQILRNKRRCISCSFGCASLLLLVILLNIYVVLPKVAAMAMRRSTLVVVNATMSNPTQTTVDMHVNVVVHDAGMFPAQVHSFISNMSWGPYEIGYQVFPAISIKAWQPIPLSIGVKVHVTNATAFGESTVQVLQGNEATFVMRGHAPVSAMGLHLTVPVEQRMTLPPTLLKKMTTTNVDILASTEDTLTTTSDSAFFSSSILEIHNFGKTMYALHPTDADGAVLKEVKMGEVTIDNFEVRRGYNLFKNTTIVLTKTPQNAPYLSKFFGTWNSGITQYVAISGPIRSGSTFLNNITTQTIEVAGIAAGMVSAGYINKQTTVSGHNPETGEKCSLIAGKDCVRGADVVMSNPVHHNLTMVNQSFDMNLHTGINYTVELKMLGFPFKRVTCDKGTMFSRMTSTSGMWSQWDPRQDNKSAVTVPASPPGGTSITSFFMTGSPQPGQSDGTYCLVAEALDPMDCCFTSLFTAAACYAQKSDKTFISASMRGNFTLQVGNFSLETHVEQAYVPVVFDQTIPNFDDGPLSIRCDDITYH